jgi:hypothetical protein
MITGYNTDVEHEGVIYHVQTEDKGLESPIVMSLVYSGGAILAAKRSSYDDLIVAGFDEAALAERLKRQHRLICAAIVAGRIEELKHLSKPQPTSSTRVIAEATIPAAAPPDPEPDHTPPAQVTASELGNTIIPDRAAEAPLALPKKAEPSPYTVYDSRRRSRLGELVRVPDGLRITLLGHEPDFHGGETIQLQAIVTRISNDVEAPLSGAAISLKILGTTFRPVLLSLKTDRDGVVNVSTEIPPFKSGRAAIVVRAAAGDLSAEARWVVHPGK